MEITEFEKKRAANLIWNGAHDYTVDPGFRVFDEQGHADLYWNSIVGAIHYHYDWKKLKLFYNTFHEKINQGVYESLFWLALENAVYQREEKERPVFPYLRRQYAKRMLGEISAGLGENRADFITEGHFRHALGEDSGLPDKVDRDLLAQIELGPELDTDQIIESLKKTLSYFFTYIPGDGKENKKERKIGNPFSLLSFRKRKAALDTSPIRHMSFGWGEHVDEYRQEILDQSHLSVAFAAYTGQTDEGLKEYITNYFGKSIYSDKEVRQLEKHYCTGNHQDVKLHITRGEYTEDMLTKGYAGKMRKEALKQAENNRKSFENDIGHYRVTIEKLTDKIRNSILTHLDDQTIKSTVGVLNASKIWRGLYLDDDRIFTKEQKGDSGNITVDILLDASGSQVNRQNIVSAQGYMIAESLTRCGIPVRVYSFCSVNGYTVVNLYRDYNENGNNNNIFNYYTTGANRDGLAIRLAAGMMKENHADHRILIVLSDCKPNDVIKVRTSAGIYKNYAEDVGVEDAAAEVHKARMENITVLCVFTGGDDSLPAAQRIYNRDFTRIHKLDMFADAVGNMLQNHIRSL